MSPPEKKMKKLTISHSEAATGKPALQSKVPSQPGLQKETLSQKANKHKRKERRRERVCD